MHSGKLKRPKNFEIIIEIGKKIKELRTQKGISQTELAKAIGASQRAVSYWESGVAEPNATIIYNLAVFFDVSADYLVGNGDY